MWLINRKVQGIEPPAALSQEMVPPSLRSHHDQPAVSIASIDFNLSKSKKCSHLFNFSVFNGISTNAKGKIQNEQACNNTNERKVAVPWQALPFYIQVYCADQPISLPATGTDFHV